MLNGRKFQRSLLYVVLMLGVFKMIISFRDIWSIGGGHTENVEERLSIPSDEEILREMKAARYQAQQERMEKLEEKRSNLDKNESDEMEHLDRSEMLKVHRRSYRKLSDEEIREMHRREVTSYKKYGTKTLDVRKDRALLMGLFPSYVTRKEGGETSGGYRNDRISDQNYVSLNLADGDVKTIFMHSTSSKSTGANKFKHNSSYNEWFQQQGCNVDQCRFTTDLKDLDTADVVHTENPHFFESIDKMLVEAANRGHHQTKKTNPNQVTISFQIESPLAAPHLLTPRTTMLKLNWTASYRLDSVLNTPYERFAPYLNATSNIGAIDRISTFESKRRTKRGSNVAGGKQEQNIKMAVWIASHCNTVNGRENYVGELEKYITVDVYGLCGTPCPRNGGKGVGRGGGEGGECLDKLDAEYRFYLAFENSNCQDYITEKVFNALR